MLVGLKWWHNATVSQVRDLPRSPTNGEDGDFEASGTLEPLTNPATDKVGWRKIPVKHRACRLHGVAGTKLSINECPSTQVVWGRSSSRHNLFACGLRGPQLPPIAFRPSRGTLQQLHIMLFALSGQRGVSQ